MYRHLKWAAGLLGACMALLLGYRVSGRFARAVADGISRPLAAHLTAATSHTPIPLAEPICIGAALAAALLLARALWRCLRAKERSAEPLLRYLEKLALAAAALMLSYALLWSAQLYAPRLEALDNVDYALPQLSAYCAELIASANELSVAAADVDTVPLTVKWSRYPELMKLLGMGGVYVPWTGETIVSGLEPRLSMPFIAAHESAHAQGYAREDEANFIAYQACMRGGARSRYSGTMYALYYSMEALHDRDEPAWERARAGMSEAVQRDYYRLNGLRTAPEPQLVQWRDAAVAALSRGGARSYGDVVELLMASRLIP